LYIPKQIYKSFQYRILNCFNIPNTYIRLERYELLDSLYLFVEYNLSHKLDTLCLESKLFFISPFMENIKQHKINKQAVLKSLQISQSVH
jgi:hypothetical protein